MICPMSVDRKPNLYLYPEKKTKMTVTMDFPHGGKVIESDPGYPEKWQNIKVKPNGKIDKKFDFLFYECEIPDVWHTSPVCWSGMVLATRLVLGNAWNQGTFCP